MTVCNFFLQGRCRYGDKCWNEHPRGGPGGGGGAGRGGGGGGGGGYNNNYNSRSAAPQQPRGGGGGFGNRVWVNPSQQKGGSYIQPSSFSSHGSDDWGRGGGGGGGGSDWGRGGGGGGGGGGGRRDNVKSSEFSFSGQNRYSSLGTPSTFDKGGRGGGLGRPGGAVGDEDDDKKLEIIQADIEAWESSGQWGFSCYSGFKAPLSGFTDLSPEELRLEYYSTRASGDLQGYINGINQLLSQWRSRVQELKIMNPATRAALLAELNNPAPQASSGDFGSSTVTGFGSSTSSFESKGFGAPPPADATSFSFAAPSSGFGSPAAAAAAASTGFGSATAAPTQPPSGFGSSSTASTAPSASNFSFGYPATNKPAASGFGSASGFSFSSTANTGGGFGSGFGAEAPAAAGNSSSFGQTSGGFGATPAPPAAGAGSAGGAVDSLFSTQSNLTPEELNQFKAKRFTLGQIPLKPPPTDMLVV
ncbi:nucleoporin NUP42 [Scomber japonicus]|uniref:nucleoporin NUP42 n=1 Tax=Scomber japonicus TaxID=13676 RepID=UPI00230505E1|nr:nucleoporin NUP42 [Scomber japonicus]